jgi:hypothetical protein
MDDLTTVPLSEFLNLAHISYKTFKRRFKEGLYPELQVFKGRGLYVVKSSIARQLRWEAQRFADKEYGHAE